MIGKITYDQIEDLLNNLITSSNNIREFASKYNGDDNISFKAKKVLNFCNDLDKYTTSLYDRVNLNKDADKIIQELKDKNN